MFIYWILYLAALLLFFLETRFTRISLIPVLQADSRAISFVIIYSAIMLMGILRHEHMGTDTYSYLNNYFLPISQKSFMQALTSDSDFGYALVNWIVSRFTNNYWIFRAIVFGLSFTSLSLWILRNSNNVALSYLVFLSLGYLEMEFYLLRLSMAVSVFVWSYRYLLERKPVKYFAFVLLAATFHKSALFMSIVYPLLSDRFKSFSTLLRAAFLIGVVVAARYGGYFITTLYRRHDYSVKMNSNHGYLQLLYYFILFAVIMFFEQRRDQDHRYRSRGFILSIAYPQILATSVSIVTRILKFSGTYLFVLLPDILSNNALRKNDKQLFFFFIITLLSLFYVYSILAGNKYPYFTHFATGV